jgi:hypothetical protein
MPAIMMPGVIIIGVTVGHGDGHGPCSTRRLVTYVRRRTSRPTRPRHDVAAGPSLHMDLFKTEPSGEAGLHYELEARMWLRTLARWRT